MRQDFQLQVGAVSETVEVAANAAALTTETAAVGGVIENKRIIVPRTLGLVVTRGYHWIYA